MNILMTYNLLGNINFVFEDAYFALLANSFVHLVETPDSEWKTTVLQMIEDTVHYVFDDNVKFIEYKKGLLVNPIQTISADQEQLKNGGKIDLSKALLVLYIIGRENSAKKRELIAIYETLLGYYLYDYTKSDEFSIGYYLKMKFTDKLKEIIRNHVTWSFKDMYTLGDFRRIVYQKTD
jgi:hypothetical protein